MMPRSPFDRAAGEHARNQQAIDLVGAFENPVDTRIAVVTLGRIVAHVAVAAVNLDVFVEHEVQHLTAGDLRNRRFNRVFLQRGERHRLIAGIVRRAVDAGLDETRGSIEEALDGIGAHDHFAQLVFDRAERRDRLAELLSLSGVAGRLAHRRLRATVAHRAELEAREIQHVECDLVTLADFAEQVFRRNPDVLENHRRGRRAVEPHLVLLFAVRDTGKGALDDEGAEEFAIDLGKNDIDVGESAVGDPGFLAIEHEAAVRLSRGPGAGAKRIRSGSRLAEAIRADQSRR